MERLESFFFLLDYFVVAFHLFKLYLFFGNSCCLPACLPAGQVGSPLIIPLCIKIFYTRFICYFLLFFICQMERLESFSFSVRLFCCSVSFDFNRNF